MRRLIAGQRLCLESFETSHNHRVWLSALCAYWCRKVVGMEGDDFCDWYVDNGHGKLYSVKIHIL